MATALAVWHLGDGVEAVVNMTRVDEGEAPMFSTLEVRVVPEDRTMFMRPRGGEWVQVTREQEVALQAILVTYMGMAQPPIPALILESELASIGTSFEVLEKVGIPIAFSN